MKSPKLTFKKHSPSTSGWIRSVLGTSPWLGTSRNRKTKDQAMAPADVLESEFLEIGRVLFQKDNLSMLSGDHVSINL
jgi:hypothetical protein